MSKSKITKSSSENVFIFFTHSFENMLVRKDAVVIYITFSILSSDVAELSKPTPTPRELQPCLFKPNLSLGHIAKPFRELHSCPRQCFEALLQLQFLREDLWQEIALGAPRPRAHSGETVHLSPLPIPLGAEQQSQDAPRAGSRGPRRLRRHARWGCYRSSHGVMLLNGR